MLDMGDVRILCFAGSPRICEVRLPIEQLKDRGYFISAVMLQYMGELPHPRLRVYSASRTMCSTHRHMKPFSLPSEKAGMSSALYVNACIESISRLFPSRWKGVA